MLRLHKAELELESISIEDEYLRSQWEAQVTAQTKIPPGRPLAKVKDIVDKVVRLEKAKGLLERQQKQLEETIINVPNDRVDVAMAEDELPEIEAKLNKVKEDLSSKQHLLGVDDEQHVCHLSQSPYLEAQLKAATYKQQLLEKLRARKFE
ncbi:hypothetical protein AAF712_015850 [Marasmius tenuissimus]|uniref:Uncharacterized protein n=1 Tax=Marasmius tenuissimus TaxID=585030 RepID=A0ABR2Z9C7_9AGAR